MKKCILTIDDRIFQREAILKASYLFLDQYYIYLSYAAEHEIAIEIEAKQDSELGRVDRRFGNELIAQMVRYQLSNSNREIKNLILGRALYSTCIDTKERPPEEDEKTAVVFPSLDEIAVDWFEQNETDSSI